MNYTILKYLSESFLGTCAQMMEVWKQAKAFGVETFELEERILMQMMFTGADLPGNFDIYLSYNQREPREYLKKSYLTRSCMIILHMISSTLNLLLSIFRFRIRILLKI